MRTLYFAPVAAIAAVALSSAALAQSQPGAGAPSNNTGAPTAPNASIAPSMVPNGAAMGTEASSMTNSGTMSADQGAGAQTAQPGMARSRRNSRHMNSHGMSSEGMSNGGMNSSAPTSSTSSPSTTPPER